MTPEVPQEAALRAPALPRRSGRWLASTQETWHRWWECGAASKLDEAGRDALGRLILLVEDLNRAETPRERRLIGDQVRKGEARLGLGRPTPPPDEPARVSTYDLTPAERAERRAALRRRHVERRGAALADLDHTVWPGYDPTESPHLTAGRYGRAPLDERSLTDAQRREVIRFNDKHRPAERTHA
jgi:hypothetical protein